MIIPQFERTSSGSIIPYEGQSSSRDPIALFLQGTERLVTIQISAEELLDMRGNRDFIAYSNNKKNFYTSKLAGKKLYEVLITKKAEVISLIAQDHLSRFKDHPIYFPVHYKFQGMEKDNAIFVDSTGAPIISSAAFLEKHKLSKDHCYVMLVDQTNTLTHLLFDSTAQKTYNPLP